jgi:putative MFS transporter
MLERLEQQKTLTLNQWKIIATANVGDMLDFFDFFLIGDVLAFILKDWQITYGQRPGGANCSDIRAAWRAPASSR